MAAAKAGDDAARRWLYEFIRARRQGVIATVGQDGTPEAALMDIAVMPGLEIIFETTDQTRKFANLLARPRIAFVIGWEGSETLQYDGMVEAASGPRLEEAWAHYLSVFPEKQSHREWPGNHCFRTYPIWVRFSDYQSPRRIEEYRFAAPQVETPNSRRWWRSLLHPLERQS